MYTTSPQDGKQEVRVYDKPVPSSLAGVMVGECQNARARSSKPIGIRLRFWSEWGVGRTKFEATGAASCTSSFFQMNKRRDRRLSQIRSKTSPMAAAGAASCLPAPKFTPFVGWISPQVQRGEGLRTRFTSGWPREANFASCIDDKLVRGKRFRSFLRVVKKPGQKSPWSQQVLSHV